MKILAIDDHPDNLTTLEAVLSDQLPGATILTAHDGPQGLKLARAEHPDVVLLDIVMPEMDGYEVCRKLKKDPDLQTIPVLFLTAIRTDRDSRIKALDAGAEGFLTKPVDEIELTAQIRAMAKIKAAALSQREINERLVSLVEERTHALLQSQTATLTLLADLKAENEARKKSEQVLRESEIKYRTLFQNSLMGISQVLPDGRLINANQAYAEMYGYRNPAEMMSEVPYIEDRFYANPEERKMVLRILHEKGVLGPIEVTVVRRDGTPFVVLVTARTIQDVANNRTLYQAEHVDITERKQAEAAKAKLESQLVQAQRMEAVGRLAGGVAHDFNNLLMGIMGYADLCRDGLPTEHPVQCYLDEITKASQRSADLTRQLVAFARRQTIEPKVLDLNDAVGGMIKLLQRLIGEDIDLVWLPATDLWPIKLDPSQVDQILANLCVNARDAIAGVGTLTIRTANVTTDQTYCADHAEFVPGEYVLLTVSDNGCGMEQDVLDHIFEPFFTTKEPGKGTGLGLATVYGIVKQNNGFIYVHSEPGQGATVTIYLPRYAGTTPESPAPCKAEVPQGRGETVLLVEDEKSLRVTCSLFLNALGYKVLVAETPAAALDMATRHKGDIHLLLTDVIMPGMNGQHLAERIQAIRPNIRCLFMSGHTANTIANRGVLDEEMHFLQKPCSRDDLARKVREVLDRSEAGA